MQPGVYTVRGANGAVTRLEVPSRGLSLDAFGKRVESGDLTVISGPGGGEPTAAAPAIATPAAKSTQPPPRPRQPRPPQRPPGRKPGGGGART